MYQDIAWQPRFCLDTDGTLSNNTVYFLSTDDPWLVAALNAPIAWWYAWRNAQHGKDEALRFAREAAETERTLAAPSGPPEPIKPAFELYGEMLLEAGQANEAVAAFEQSLLRTPKRTPSVLGLARAAVAAGDSATARTRYQELTTMPGVSPDSPAVQEAQKALKSTNNF